MAQNEKILDRQIATLIRNAPDDGVTPGAVGITLSVLKEIAMQLSHSQYYIVTDQKGGWLLTTLSNRNSPEIEKNAIHAYSSYAAANVERLKIDAGKGLKCDEVGIIEILFRLLGLDEVDSLILFDKSTDTQKGTEISRAELKGMCEKQLKRVQFSQSKLNRTRSSGGFVPHNIA